MRNDLLPGIYKQMTPTKRLMLAAENIPQGVMAIIYERREGGSIIVTVLNLCIPAVQIAVSFLLYYPLRRAVAPWYAGRFDAALRASDESMLEPLLVEAGLQHDRGLRRDVATHFTFFEEELNFKTRLPRDGGSVIVEHRVDFISRCLFALGPGNHTLHLSLRPHKDDDVLLSELRALKFFLEKTKFIDYDLLLDGNSIKENHVKVLIDILRLGTIRSIDLQKCGLSDDAAEALAKALRYTAVT